MDQRRDDGVDFFSIDIDVLTQLESKNEVKMSEDTVSASNGDGSNDEKTEIGMKEAFFAVEFKGS